MLPAALVLGMLAISDVSAAPSQCVPGGCDDGDACTVDVCSATAAPGVATLFIGHDIQQLERQYHKIGTFIQTWGVMPKATGAAIDANDVVYICNPSYGNNLIERRGPGNTNLGTITATVNNQWIEDLGNFGGGFILAGTIEGDVWRIDTTTGAHTLQFSTGQSFIGVTFDGTDIWTTGGYTSTLVHRRDLAGNVLSTFNTGRTNLGIGYDPDDGTLWIGHFNGQVMHYSQTGVLLGGFTSIAAGPLVDGVELAKLSLPAGCQHNPIDCNDDDFCTVDTCDPVAGCSNPPNVCNDSNPCTDDACDPQAACIYTNNTADCDDVDPCDTGATCSGGLCQPGTPIACDDANLCTTDSCDPHFGCVYTDNANLCDDGNACTIEDLCSGGACQPGVPVACTDGDVCTSDTCDPMTGCVYTNQPNGSPCDDGNACTTGEVCVGGTCQLGVGLACSPSDQCHVAGICDPLTGLCSNPAAPNGTACNDGNPCTGGDVCVNGVCGGAAVGVPAETQSLSAVADKVTYSWLPAPEATSYDAARGQALPVGSSSADEVCFEGLTAAKLADTTTPGPGTVFWYLSRAIGPCGPGPWGTQSNGTAQVPSVCP